MGRAGIEEWGVSFCTSLASWSSGGVPIPFQASVYPNLKEDQAAMFKLGSARLYIQPNTNTMQLWKHAFYLNSWWFKEKGQ
jgi:hypothetical protein